MFKFKSKFNFNRLRSDSKSYKIIVGVSSIICSVAVTVFAVYLFTLAGTITSPGDPSSAGRMYTLKNIYDYLNSVDSAVPTKPAGAFATPDAGPAGTMYTTDDIFAKLTRQPATGQVTSYPTSIPDWAASTAYTLVSKVKDPVDSSYWICNVAHTSGTGTMAADRTAHPTYWLSVTVDNFDDGYYKAGATLLYGDVTVNSLLVAVNDLNTGLMWNKCSAGLSGDTCATGAAAIKSWQAAIAYCEHLRLCGDGTYQGSEASEGDCGFTSVISTDWRLPNAKELQSIVNYGNWSPAIGEATVGGSGTGAPFRNTQSLYYWSSTTYAGYAPYAWVVHFYDGYVNYSVKTSSYYVRCVRQ